jgi:hypothetical protein
MSSANHVMAVSGTKRGESRHSGTEKGEFFPDMVATNEIDERPKRNVCG